MRVCALSLSRVPLLVTLWTVACHALSMEFSRQRYWSGCHFLFQGIFPDQGSNLVSYVPCIGRWTLYHWATWEAPVLPDPTLKSWTSDLLLPLLLSSVTFSDTSLVAQMVKHLPTMRESWVWSLGQEDPLEKEMATHSSIHAWKIPWTKEPGGLQSMVLQRVGHDGVTSLHFTSLHIQWHCLIFPWDKSPYMDKSPFKNVKVYYLSQTLIRFIYFLNVWKMF